MHLLSDDQRDGFMKAAGLLSTCVESGMAPEGAIKKVASERRFTPELTRRLCECFNLSRTYHQFRTNEKLDDKLAHVELVDADKLIAQMFPKQASADESVPGFYHRTLDDFVTRKPKPVLRQKQQQKAASVETGSPAISSRLHEVKNLYKKACATLASAQLETAAFDRLADRAAQQLKSAGVSICDAEVRMRLAFGDDAEASIAVLAERTGGPRADLAKQAGHVFVTDFSREPFSTLGDLVKVAMRVRGLCKEYAALDRSLTVKLLELPKAAATEEERNFIRSWVRANSFFGRSGRLVKSALDPATEEFLRFYDIPREVLRIPGVRTKLESHRQQQQAAQQTQLAAEARRAATAQADLSAIQQELETEQSLGGQFRNLGEAAKQLGTWAPELFPTPGLDPVRQSLLGDYAERARDAEALKMESEQQKMDIASAGELRNIAKALYDATGEARAVSKEEREKRKEPREVEKTEREEITHATRLAQELSGRVDPKVIAQLTNTDPKVRENALSIVRRSLADPSKEEKLKREVGKEQLRALKGERRAKQPLRQIAAGMYERLGAMGGVGELAEQIRQRNEEAIDVADIFTPEHEQELLRIKAQALLNRLLTTDPVIKGYPPEDVVEAFNEVRDIRPELLDKPSVVRGLLRKYLEEQHQLEPTFAVGLVERPEKEER